MLKQQRACLAALAYLRIGRRLTVAGADDVAVAGKQLGFDKGQFAIGANGRVKHQKQCIAKGLQLGPGVPLKGVFQRQLMQVELSLQVAQLLTARVVQADPDKVAGLFRPLLALIKADSADFQPIAVNSGGNHSTHDASLIGWFQHAA